MLGIVRMYVMSSTGSSNTNVGRDSDAVVRGGFGANALQGAMELRGMQCKPKLFAASRGAGEGDNEQSRQRLWRIVARQDERKMLWALDRQVE